MKKTSFKNLALIAIFLLIAIRTFAQNSDAKTLPETSASTIENLTTQTPTATNPTSNTVDKTNNSTISPEKKLDLVNKPLENSALVDKIQGGMANLLLGNKSTSLMFDDRENDNIERAIDSFKNNQSYTPDGNEDGDPNNANSQQKKAEEEEAKAKKEQDDFNAKSYIYLASIMYSTSQDWVVWINDKKITSETNKKSKELFLDSVSKDRVSIMWNVSPSKMKVLLGAKADSLNLKTNSDGQIEVKFALQPNQTFMLGSNTVVEGKLVTNMIKQKSDSPTNSPSAVDSKADSKVDSVVKNKYKTRINQ